MRTVPIVAMEPGLEMGGAMSGVGINSGIGPFAQRGLDETFGFAIGAWRVGKGEEVAQAEALAGIAELMGAIARAVVAHDPLGFNAQGSEVSQGTLEENHGTLVALIRHDLGKGETGSVVDADMDKFPPGPADLVAPVVRDSVTWTDDSPQLFDIEVEQFPWELALVADHRWSGLEGAEPGQAVAAEQP